MTIKELKEKAQTETYVTVNQLAVLVQYHPRSLYRMIEAGRLPGVTRIGGGRTIRIDKAEALKKIPPKSPNGNGHDGDQGGTL